jgi:hypothetical protein
MYRDTTNVEPEMYDYANNNWSTGIVTRSLRKHVEDIPGNHSIDSLQKTAILGTSHIIRKVLQCEPWSLSGGDHRWFRRSTRKKRPVTRDDVNNNDDDNNNNNYYYYYYKSSAFTHCHTVQEQWLEIRDPEDRSTTIIRNFWHSEKTSHDHKAWINLFKMAADSTLTLNLLTTTIVAPPSNGSKWQMGFNSAFKGWRCHSDLSAACESSRDVELVGK